jgi:hypothetical protein
MMWTIAERRHQQTGPIVTKIITMTVILNGCKKEAGSGEAFLLFGAAGRFYRSAVV